MNQFLDYQKTKSHASFRAVVMTYSNMVYGTAMRMTRSRELSEEVSQNVFTLLSRKAGGIRDPKLLPAWLHRTAIHMSKSALRSEIRHRRRLEKFHTTEMKTQHEDPSTSEAVSLLDELISRLPKKDQTLLWLRFHEEKNFRQISQAIGSSEAACQKKTRRLIERLRASFSKKGVTLSIGAVTGLLSQELSYAAHAETAQTVAQAIADQHIHASAANMGSQLSANLIQDFLLSTKIIYMKIKTTLAIVIATACVLTASFLIYHNLTHSNEGQNYRSENQNLSSNPHSRLSSLGSKTGQNRKQKLSKIFELYASSKDENFRQFLRSWLLDEAYKTQNVELGKKAWNLDPNAKNRYSKPHIPYDRLRLIARSHLIGEPYFPDLKRIAALDPEFALSQITRDDGSRAPDSLWVVLTEMASVDLEKAAKTALSLPDKGPEFQIALRALDDLETEVQKASNLNPNGVEHVDYRLAAKILGHHDLERSLAVLDSDKYITKDLSTKATNASCLPSVFEIYREVYRKTPALAYQHLKDLQADNKDPNDQDLSLVTKVNQRYIPVITDASTAKPIVLSPWPNEDPSLITPIGDLTLKVAAEHDLEGVLHWMSQDLEDDTRSKRFLLIADRVIQKKGFGEVLDFVKNSLSDEIARSRVAVGVAQNQYLYLTSTEHSRLRELVSPQDLKQFDDYMDSRTPIDVAPAPELSEEQLELGKKGLLIEGLRTAETREDTLSLIEMSGHEIPENLPEIDQGPSSLEKFTSAQLRRERRRRAHELASNDLYTAYQVAQNPLLGEEKWIYPYSGVSGGDWMKTSAAIDPSWLVEVYLSGNE